MNDKLYIKKFIRDDGETLAFDGDEIYLAQENTLLTRPDPRTSAVEYTEADGGEMIHQQNAIYEQPINGLIIPKSKTYWELVTILSKFFRVNHYYKIIYTKKNGEMFAISSAWISSGLQVVPVPHEEYSSWSITFAIGNTAWTEYAEDSSGKEIYSNNIVLPLLTADAGGEIWETPEKHELTAEGASFALNSGINTPILTDTQLKGDTTQITYSGKNLFSGDYAQFDNTGGTGSTYAYFKLPDDGTYQFTLIAKNAVSGTSSTYLGFTSTGGSTTDPRNWAWSSSSSSTVGQVITRSNVSGNNKLQYVSLYSKSSTTLQWFTNNFDIMLEKSDTPTSYEPYVGGTASPNPDYPQTVNVVTGEQTVTVRGKNLFDKSNYNLVNGYFNGSPNGTITANAANVIYYIPCNPNTTYTVSKVATKNFAVAYSAVTPSAGSSFSGRVTANDLTSATITTDSSAKYLIVWARNGNIAGEASAQDVLDSLQIETGSTATSYEPYQSQSYTVDLDTLELCKIGTYQDKIYKSGDDWYVWKEVGKVVLTGTSGENWTTIANRNNGSTFYAQTAVVDSTILGVTGNYAISDHFSPLDGLWGDSESEGLWSYGAQADHKLRFRIFKTSLSSVDIDGFKSWLSSNNTIVYYALATPTDTKITDADLIADLEALAGADCYKEQTNFTVTAGGLPGILAVEAEYYTSGGEEWDSVGGEWEVGTGGVQTINIQSTQNVYPIWTVEGPCVNPLLQNNTTDTVAVYNGTVASGQTLVVDFEAGTAHLNSALVTKYVTGLVSFAPGENTVGFNSDGGTTETSTISWNNIIN